MRGERGSSLFWFLPETGGCKQEASRLRQEAARFSRKREGVRELGFLTNPGKRFSRKREGVSEGL